MSNAAPPGHWYPALSSRELGRRPLGCVRFGRRLVFWRGPDGRPVCHDDRCPHRGAALSRGRVGADGLTCPFHGISYGPDGRCTGIPVERNQALREALGLRSHAVHESDGYVWLWRGAGGGAPPKPPPRLALPERAAWGEMRWDWQAHYTRCVESVVDYSHLPFVHRWTLGRRISDPATEVIVEDLPQGFRARKVGDRYANQYVELVYPATWLNGIGGDFLLSAAFAPVDEQLTRAYIRWYHPLRAAPLQPLANAIGRLASWIVFRDDQPILASQRPSNSDGASGEHLLPSDAAVIAYRKLRRAHARAAEPAEP